MTTLELNKIKAEYAKEDLQLAKENGAVCITNTKYGLLTVKAENGKFEFIAGNNVEPFLTESNEMYAVDFIANAYTVEQN